MNGRLRLNKQLAAAEASPEDIENRRQALLSALEIADNERKDTSDKLRAAEAALAERDKALKETSEGRQARVNGKSAPKPLLKTQSTAARISRARSANALSARPPISLKR
ncbi:hypothetical protein [Kordiimonas gwangyangensis]|uniref:hypothetical protein n=1 Tax=Kordiimonas gwangyangensis TaxID=288022 RepID=UPI00068761FC|nr:hypothetical protein [Kordiimonas gwangyangensis]